MIKVGGGINTRDSKSAETRFIWVDYKYYKGNWMFYLSPQNLNEQPPSRLNRDQKQTQLTPVQV